MKRLAYEKAKVLLSEMMEDLMDGNVEDKYEDDVGDMLQHYPLIDEHGEVELNREHACYSDLLFKRFDITQPEAFISLTHQFYEGKDFDSEQAEGYISWLVNESVFAPVFQRKNVAEILNEGIICHTDIPHRLFGAAIIAHRTSYEYPLLVKTWNFLVEGGVNKDMAFLMMQAMTMGTEGELSSLRCVTNHTPSTSLLTEDGARAFLKRMVPEDATFKELCSYSQTGSMWDEYGTGPEFHYSLSIDVPSKAVETDDCFAPVKYVPDEQEYLKWVLELQHEMMGELNEG